MRSFRPDVVNVHFPDHQIRFVLALHRRFKFRLVVSLHGHEVERVSDWNASKHSATARRLQSILREADAVTACSRHLLDQAVQVEPSIANKGHVIHNGIDPKRFIDRSSYVHPRPYAFAFGRLTYKKGFDMLLDAFAQAKSVAQEIDLIIAGEGEEHKALELRAQQLGLRSRVHFPGRATETEVIRLLNGSLFVVVPSRCEPFGIVALEALAAGKPVLATKTGGLAEFLTEFSNGAVVTLVDPNVEKLTAGLLQMFELPLNPLRELRDYHLADKYSWAQVTRLYENVFAQRCQS
jgi:glycosyltransferase involved in cell wall biosynthesis